MQTERKEKSIPIIGGQGWKIKLTITTEKIKEEQVREDE